MWNLGIFMSFWLIMIRYIPFDVIMQTETGKIIYSKFMEWDLEMTHFDAEQNKYISCNVQSMQLPEALGEIDHIFCDKTGTLTLNDLDVNSISVSGMVCHGDTREQINSMVEEQCNRLDAEHLFQCFCLCAEMRVIYNSKTGQNSYDGES